MRSLHSPGLRAAMRGGAGLVAALALLTGCSELTLRGFFVDSAYPKKVKPIPPRDMELSVNSSLMPSLLVGYQSPHAAGECLAELAVDQTALEAMTQYGACLAEGRPRGECSRGLPWITSGPRPYSRRPSPAPAATTPATCPTRLPSKLDQMRMYLSLGETAEAVYSYHLNTRGQAAVGAPLEPALSAGLTGSMQHASRILKLDPRAQRSPEQPTFAISGGAANGAYMAGYAYGMFWLREKARLYGTPEQKDAIDDYRFEGAATSSVGTLVALALDLYFSDQKPSPKQEKELDACIARAGAPVSGQPDRKLQDCGLAQLRTNFKQNEWDLLCAQHGTVLKLLGDDFTGLLRFDPLQKNILEPFFRDFKDILLGNGFTRTAMAVDMNQGVLVGLDERACLTPGMNQDRCLISGSLASIIEPIFAAPMDVVYSGLRGTAGERGTWIDGSIRSLNPASRAASFGMGKVLVLNPARSEGVPSERIGQMTEQFVHTTDALGAAQRNWEFAYAQGYLKQRQDNACTLARLTGNSSMCGAPRRGPRFMPGPMLPRGFPAPPTPPPPSTSGGPPMRGLPPGPPGGGPSPMSVPATDPGGSALAVWVPEEIEPKTLFASGYAFDPLVMSALFAWGQQQALKDRKRVFEWLGWCAILAMEDGGVSCPVKGVSTTYRKRVEEQRRLVRQEVDSYRKYNDKVLWQKHLDERRRALKKNFKDCK